ncbi:hypothetical protein DID75_02485 [Candidatus Marinamargulisbacteria bacterium SCGC AG-410-N11]|nr:hypothetical protein DID75_02485 [Candidatus Marinamargulisbacteria bacterium SCGC AG-410-N11]
MGAVIILGASLLGWLFFKRTRKVATVKVRNKGDATKTREPSSLFSYNSFKSTFVFLLTLAFCTTLVPIFNGAGFHGDIYAYIDTTYGTDSAIVDDGWGHGGKKIQENVSEGTVLATLSESLDANAVFEMHVTTSGGSTAISDDTKRDGDDNKVYLNAAGTDQFGYKLEQSGSDWQIVSFGDWDYEAKDKSGESEDSRARLVSKDSSGTILSNQAISGTFSPGNIDEATTITTGDDEYILDDNLYQDGGSSFADNLTVDQMNWQSRTDYTTGDYSAGIPASEIPYLLKVPLNDKIGSLNITSVEAYKDGEQDASIDLSSDFEFALNSQNELPDDYHLLKVTNTDNINYSNVDEIRITISVVASGVDSASSEVLKILISEGTGNDNNNDHGNSGNSNQGDQGHSNNDGGGAQASTIGFTLETADYIVSSSGHEHVAETIEDGDVIGTLTESETYTSFQLQAGSETGGFSDVAKIYLNVDGSNAETADRFGYEIGGDNNDKIVAFGTWDYENNISGPAQVLSKNGDTTVSTMTMFNMEIMMENINEDSTFMDDYIGDGGSPLPELTSIAENSNDYTEVFNYLGNPHKIVKIGGPNTDGNPVNNVHNIILSDYISGTIGDQMDINAYNDGLAEVTVDSVIDQDGQDIANHGFSILDAGENKLLLKHTGTLDYETATEYNITLRVKDLETDDNSDTVTITITVTNVEDVDLGFFANDSLTIAEGVAGPVGDISATDDRGYSLTYSLPDGQGNNDLYSIDAASGALTLNTAVNDIITNVEHTVKVSVSNGSDTETSDFLVTIANNTANDNSAPHSLTIDDADVNENETLVGTLSAVDDDEGDNLTYSVPDGSAYNIKNVNELHLNEALDFEGEGISADLEDVTVTVSDGSLTAQLILTTITLVDVNEAPSGLVLRNSANDADDHNVDENHTVVGYLFATDPEGDALTFSVEGNVFEIDDVTLNGVAGYKELKLKNSLNFEDNGANPADAGTARVTVSDGSLTQGPVDFEITLVDVNEAPSLGDITVAKDESSTGTIQLAATDPDAGDSLNYSFTGAGQISVSGSDVSYTLPRGAGAQYTGTITVSDGDLTDTATITITALDVATPEDGPSVINVSNERTAAVDENLGAGLVEIATVTVSLTGGGSGSWSINTNSGDHSKFSKDGNVLKFNQEGLNYEALGDANNDDIFSVTITGTGGATDDTKTFNVSVADVNEAPGISSDAVTVATEDAEYSYILTSTDVDAGDDANSATFTITKPDWLTFDAVDRKLSGTPNNSHVGEHNITIDIADDGGLAGDAQTFTITVANDAPTIATIEEDDVTATEEILFSYDINTDDEAHTKADTTQSITIKEGTDPLPDWLSLSAAGVLSGTPNNGDALAGQDGFSITVVANDGNSGTDEKTFTFKTVNVNDAPVLDTLDDNYNTAENDNPVVFTASATDEDNDDTADLSFSLDGADADLFEINGSTGVANFKEAPNFEVPSGSDGIYEITVIVTDPGGLTSQDDITITVTDVNEAPFLGVVDGDNEDETAFELNENADLSTDIIELQFADVDSYNYDVDEPGAHHGNNFEIRGADKDLFELVDTDGDGTDDSIQVKNQLNFEEPVDNGADGVYDLTIAIVDNGSLEATQNITITILDVNETPEITLTGTNSLAENADLSSDIISFSSTDVDRNGHELAEPGDHHGYDYEIKEVGDYALFELVDEDEDGINDAIQVKNQLNFEVPEDSNNDGIYELTIAVVDNGTLEHTQALSLTITDVNETPVISITGNDEDDDDDYSLNENADLSGITVSSTDVDRAGHDTNDDDTFQTYTYTKSGADAGIFNINADTGVLSLKNQMNFENMEDVDLDGIYELTVTVTDGAGLTTSEDLTLTILDVNEAPTAIFVSLADLQTDVPATMTVVINDVDVYDNHSTGSFDNDTDNLFAKYQLLTTIETSDYTLGEWSDPVFNTMAGTVTYTRSIEAELGLFGTVANNWDSGGVDSLQDVSIEVGAINENINEHVQSETIAINIARNTDYHVYGTDGTDTTADATDTDDDGDRLLDGQEQQFDYSSKNPDSGGIGTTDDLKDYDSDGITNYDEINAANTYEETATVTDATLADTDGDGLGDLFEFLIAADSMIIADSSKTAANLHATDPNDKDSDADGIIDGIEVLGFKIDLALDTTDDKTVNYVTTEIIVTSNPRSVDTDGDGINDNVELGWQGASGDLYGEANANEVAINWNKENGNSKTFEFENLSTYTNFLQATAAVQDKTTTTLANLITNPNNADTDGDNIDDNVELTARNLTFSVDLTKDRADNPTQLTVSVITNPILTDTDGDGISDSAELSTDAPYSAITNPLDVDTDNDGISDKDEQDTRSFNITKIIDGTSSTTAVDITTNPLDIDSDNDGMSDGQELLLVKYMNNNRITNPNVADTDNDGILDTDEVQNRVITFKLHKESTTTPNEFEDFNHEYTDLTTDPNDDDSDNDTIKDGPELADADGVEDFTTSTTGQDIYITNPRIKDTDGDGIDDNVEYIDYLTIQVHEDMAHYEGTNAADSSKEIKIYSNPLSADTDGDGKYSDKDEHDGYSITVLKKVVDDAGTISKVETSLAIRTNSTKLDTDNDNILDNVERDGWIIAIDKSITGTADAQDTRVKSNAAAIDTDHDTLVDYDEKTGLKYSINKTRYHDLDVNESDDIFTSELVYTNPSSVDTDGDDVLDNIEKNGRTFNTSYRSHGAIADTDHDGVSDFNDDYPHDELRSVVSTTWKSHGNHGILHFASDYPRQNMASREYGPLALKYMAKEFRDSSDNIKRIELMVWTDMYLGINNFNSDLAIKFPELTYDDMSATVRGYQVKLSADGIVGIEAQEVKYPSSPETSHQEYRVKGSAVSDPAIDYYKGNDFAIFGLTGEVGAANSGGDSGTNAGWQNLLGMFLKGNATKITVVFDDAQPESKVGRPPYGLFLIRGKDMGQSDNGHGANLKATKFEQHLPGEKLSNRFLEALALGRGSLMTVTEGDTTKDLRSREGGQADAKAEKDGVIFDTRTKAEKDTKMIAEAMYVWAYDNSGNALKLPVVFDTKGANRSMFNAAGTLRMSISDTIKNVLMSGESNVNISVDTAHTDTLKEHESNVPGMIQQEGVSK